MGKQIPRPPTKQRGYALFMISVLLTVLMLVGIQFLARASSSLQLAAYARDSGEALLVAENSMNMLFGQFLNGADLDLDGRRDIEEAALDPAAIPATLPLPYLYYVTAGSGVDQDSPSLLQRVANGEAHNRQTPLSAPAVSSAANHLRIDDLFGVGFAPRVYVQHDDGRFAPAARSWNAETERKKGVAWLELTRGRDGDLRLYACGVGQVGTSRAYVQRQIGQVSAPVLGGSIAPLIQS